jgi:hypothetical protein
MGTLNLFLHGLFAIVEEPYRIVLAVPFCRDHDTYELEVLGDATALHYGRGNYELVGVKIGANSVSNCLPVFCPDKTARLGSNDPSFTEVYCIAPRAYATFTLPRPHRVYCCECYKRGVDLDFEGDNAGEVAATEFARIIGITYEFDDIHRVGFTGLPGLKMHYTPGTNDWDPVKYVNAVIVSAGPHPNSTSITNSFNEMMKALVPSKDLSLIPLSPTATPPSDCTNIPGAPREVLDGLLLSQANFNPLDCIPVVIDNASPRPIP